MLAAAIDSALDILSGSIIFITHRLRRKINVEEFPVGKSRYENLGIIIFASVMGTASLQVITESVRRLTDAAAAHFDPNVFTLCVLGVTIGSKIVVYFWCRSLRSVNAGCDALSQDARNDIITNSISILFVYLGK